MKKALAFTLLLLMLSCLFMPALAVNEDIEGKVVIYTSTYQDAINALDRELKKEFPNLEVTIVYNGSGSVQTKLAGEMGPNLDGVLSCDMLLVAEPSYAFELKEYGYLEPIPLENAENMFRFDYDKDGYWYPARVCNMVLAYNPEKTDESLVPKSFKAFAEDESLKGRISMGNPLTSGTALAACAALSDLYGYEYFDALGRNAVMVESGSTALAKLQSGECTAIMILEESVLTARKKDGSPITCIYPEDGVVLIPSPVMTIAESKSANANIEACEAITRWLLSPEGQHCIIAEGEMHGVLKGNDDTPYDSLSTDEMVAKDIGVDWMKVYHDRETIRTRFQEAVTMN